MATKKPAWEQAAKKATPAADPLAARVESAAKTVAAIPEERAPHQYQKGFKPPKKLAQCADEYYKAREARLAMEKEVAKLELIEGDYKAYLLEKLPLETASGISGSIVRVSIVTKNAPRAESWPDVYAAIVADYTKHAKKKDGQQDSAFGLLGRSLSAATINALWKDGKTVAGVGSFPVTSLSVNKL